MNKIYLYLEDIPLGYLIESDGGYTFYADRENIADAKESHGIPMRLFNLNTSGMKKYDKIPHLFSVYLDGVNREDIVTSAGINDKDSDFAKLYKMSKLNLHPINFVIKQND